jgi:4-amino-4-deoxy-L-arabinose transferase-like glycosyltransferase
MNSKSDKTNSSSSQLSNIQKVFYGGLLLGIFFFAGNGVIGLTHPDEVFYTQTAVEMLQHKTWLTPYLFDGPNFEKPIVTYWLLMIAFKVFGVTAFGARFFPAVFASIGIIGIYFLGKIAFRDEKKALCGALVMMSSALYFGLARTVFTDMFFTVFIELALVSFYWGYSVAKRKSLGTILFWVFAALAALSKGILGLAIPFAVMFVFLVLRKELKFIFNRVFVIGFLLFLLIALPWYLFMIKTFGQSFISEFFYNDHVRRLLEAEHGSNDKWFFYPLSMVALMMPWSLFLVAAAGGFFKRVWEKSSPIYLFLLCWLAVTFTVFQIAHSKLVSYILPLFPVLAIITGDKVAEMIEKQKDKKFFIISALLLPLLSSSVRLLDSSIIRSIFLRQVLSFLCWPVILVF